MRYTPLTITTAIMLVMTIYLMIGRFRSRADSNWPLFYYLFLVAYHQALPGRLNAYAVYSAVVSALFIRFEFLHSFLSKVIRICELIILAYLALRFLELTGL